MTARSTFSPGRPPQPPSASSGSSPRSRAGEFLSLHGHARVAVRRADDAVRDHLHLVADLFVAAPHEPLDRVDGVLRVRDGLPLGDLSDEPLSRLREPDDEGVVRPPSEFAMTSALRPP